jgi:hypothetical protein
VLPHGWAGLAALLDGHPDADPMNRAKRLCDLCVDTAGVSGVALGIVSGEHRSTVYATDEVAARVGDLELTFSEGPGVDAVRDRAPVLVPDLSETSNSRWPWFTPAAVEAGARAVFVFPVQVGAIRMGWLGLLPGPHRCPAAGAAH